MASSTRNLFAGVARGYRLALLALSTPIILGRYFRPETGAQYGVDTGTKISLMVKMARNNLRIPTGSTFLEHLIIATEILSVLRDADGCLVECGCYKGGSTANLSLVAGLCDRELHVFDSFEGMPEPDEDDREHVLVDSKQIHTYEKDAWQGSLGEVRSNIARYGDVSACTFHRGYFEETLPEFTDQCALVFLDVGLRASAETCLTYLWPHLRNGGFLFTHDVKHMEIAALFFDTDWWRTNVDCAPPGLVGAGNGIGLHPGSDGFNSLLGYTIKAPDKIAFEEVAETGEGENRVSLVHRD